MASNRGRCPRVLSLAIVLLSSGAVHSFQPLFNLDSRPRICCRRTPPQPQTTAIGPTSRIPTQRQASGKDKRDADFWAQQKALVVEMKDNAAKSLKREQMEKFEARSRGLVSDTAFFSMIIFPVLWALFDNPFISLSYLLGAVFGLAYTYGLGKYVATLGGSVDDATTTEGAGIGGARFAFLILLFVIVGKFRSAGLIEIPCIMGFFTYQLASLSEGLKERYD